MSYPLDSLANALTAWVTSNRGAPSRLELRLDKFVQAYDRRTDAIVDQTLAYRQRTVEQADRPTVASQKPYEYFEGQH